MERKNVSFKIEKSKKEKSDFYKNKKLFKKEDTGVNKLLASKKESYGTNISLDIVVMMSLDHYVKSFQNDLVC